MQNGLRELRLQSHMTLEELGNVLGISASAVGHLEHGRRHLYDDQLLKLSSLFSVSTDRILGSTQVSEDDPAYLLDQRTRALINSAISDLTDEEKLLFHQLLSSFLNLSIKGKTELADSADTMVRSGKYAELGETSFSGPDTRVQAAGAA